MKNYTILLMPENILADKIKDLRWHHVHSELVDGLTPHITLKRRFTINEGFNEKDITKIVKDFNISKFELYFDTIDKFFNAIILTSHNEKLLEKHKELLNLLNNKITTLKPELEGSNFKTHLTLFRSNNDIELNIDPIKVGFFDKISLFEIDSASSRSFAREIFSKTI